MYLYREIDSCMTYGKMAADCFLKTRQTYEYTKTLITMGEALHVAGNLKSAKHYFEQAIDLSEQNGGGGFKSVRQITLAHLAKICFSMGEYRKAYLLRTESIKLRDSLSNESKVRDMALLESRYEFNKQRVSDSINHHYEILRIETEHQQALRKKQSQNRVVLTIALVFILVSVIIFFYYKAVKENEENNLQRKALEIERSLLRTQMNPHFIFNALNSVQSFIVNNNTSEAVRYLSKFAKLIRMILNNSMHRFVLLSDEIASLSLYLDLEQVRFNNRFSYKIEIDDNVEEDLVKVPPMLIQPFVENSILHGLMHKTEGGLITICLTENGNNTLTCTVTDNGVGRKAAAEIESRNEHSHKSVGMQLTRGRLQELNNSTQHSCTITDLEDPDGKTLGTQVIIIIPERVLKKHIFKPIKNISDESCNN